MATLDGFWEIVCGYQSLLRVLVATLVVMAGLLAFSFLFLEPGTGSYVIALVDLVLLAVAFVLVGGVTVVCARRADC